MDRKTFDFLKDLNEVRIKRARKRPRTEEVVPDVLVYNVARFLGIEELGRMMQVSQQFNRVIGKSADLWNRHYENMLSDESQNLPVGDAVKGYQRLRISKAWAKKGFLRLRAKFRTNIEKSRKSKKNNESGTKNMINMISTKDVLIMVMNNKLYEYPKTHLRTHESFAPKVIADIGKGFSKKFSSLAFCPKSKILFSGFDNGEVGVAKLSGKGRRGFMQKIIGEEINSVSCVESNYCVTSTEKLNIFKLNEKGDWLDRYDITIIILNKIFSACCRLIIRCGSRKESSLLMERNSALRLPKVISQSTTLNRPQTLI